MIAIFSIEMRTAVLRWIVRKFVSACVITNANGASATTRRRYVELVNGARLRVPSPVDIRKYSRVGLILVGIPESRFAWLNAPLLPAPAGDKLGGGSPQALWTSTGVLPAST